MTASHGETTLKQEAYKLEVSTIGLFNQNIKHV